MNPLRPALASILLAAAAHAAPNPAPSVVPALQQWTGAEGVFAATSAEIVVDAASKEKFAGTAALFAADLKTLGFGKHAVRFAAAPQPGHFFLTAANDSKLHPEGYKLEIADAAVLRSDSAAGLFYATRTVLQILAQDKAGCALPKGAAVDFPSYQRRMLMLDVGRKPFPIAVIEDYMRILAWYKMNELHLHFSDEAFGGSYAAFRIQSDSFPGLAAKDLSYTKADIRKLQDFAKARGITVTPEFDMPGHARCFTNYWPETMLKGYPNYVDVTNPKTIENMKKLLDEMIPLFDCPDIHIGTDEYRVGNRPDLHEAFRQFINTMNAHIRSKGKNCRIWSGFEHMKGATEIDPTVIIDMWETDNARGQIEKGHKIINSNQHRTYIVPGCHYYGISCQGIYNGWEPWMVSGDMAKNPSKNDPNLLGGKLHVWCDQGPTGYTHTEIADLALPGIQAFAEKLWGTQGSPDYTAFTKRAAATLPLPSITILDRLPVKSNDGVVLDLPKEQLLAGAGSAIALPLAKAARADLEYPWTLTLEVCKTAETGTRQVLLSSDLVEICGNYSMDKEVVTDFADGTKRKSKIKMSGFGTVRTAGARTGATPADSYLYHDVSYSCGKPLPLNQWTSIAVVGTRGSTAFYISGEKVGETNNQMVCPLRWIGSPGGQSLTGRIRNLKVVNRALSPKEIGRTAGLDIPENLAAGCPVTASASDSSHGFTPENVTDGDAGTRWSSAPTGAPQWVAVDLKAAKSLGRIALNWEDAFPKKYAVDLSDDGTSWREVFHGEGRVGGTLAEFAPATARHIRIRMSDAATQWGYSIRELEAWPPKKK